MRLETDLIFLNSMMSLSGRARRWQRAMNFFSDLNEVDLWSYNTALSCLEMLGAIHSCLAFAAMESLVYHVLSRKRKQKSIYMSGT